MAEALSDDARLTSDVCLSRTSRTERPIGTEVAHVIRDTTFKVKRSKVNLQGAVHIVAASRTACLEVFLCRVLYVVALCQLLLQNH